MTERPIVLRRHEVVGIIAGTQTQLRRVVKPVGNDEGFVLKEYGDGFWPYRSADGESGFYRDREGYDVEERVKCPFGRPGDRLWGREAWKAHTTFDHLSPRDIPQSHIWYMADEGYKAQSRFRQAMFMPRWASRITLEITGVRVERLGQISEPDAIAEGVNSVDEYIDLWKSINKTWEPETWIWAVEFKRIKEQQT